MRWRSPLLFAGPAVIASIAYMDPGNFATNIQAGAKYGYALLWVVLIANVTAMLYQALSAKLGIVTGRNLAELCRDHFSKPVVWALWIVSEVAAMATDLAEFLGGAIGLSLLLHVPLIAGMGVTAVLTYGLLMFDGRGFRPIELIIGALVAAIALCYLVEMVIAPIDWAAAGVFLTALLASGLSSSAVGTMAGQMIMQGFVGFRIPIIVRRLVTMIPAFVVVWFGVNSTNALIVSQVVLSIALPAPVIALILFTRRKDIMGAFTNSRLTNAAAAFGAFVILTLNTVLLLQAFGVDLPGLPSG
jgi:Mn2+/Fe2+ NRAMP family transporter